MYRHASLQACHGRGRVSHGGRAAGVLVRGRVWQGDGLLLRPDGAELQTRAVRVSGRRHQGRQGSHRSTALTGSCRRCMGITKYR